MSVKNMPIKKLRNMEKDCPDVYDMEYWSDDGERFNYVLFNRDLCMWIHNLTERLESSKMTFPNIQNILAFPEGEFPKGFPYESYCADVISWFRREFGTHGLISRKDRRAVLNRREE